MFKKLFKPKWQSAKPQVRIQALQTLDINDQNDFHVIELMAKGDVERDVRLAAMKRIPQKDKLITLIRQEKDNAVRFSAIEHLVATLGQHQAGIDPVVQDMVSDLDTHALIGIVEQTQNVELGSHAIGQLDDESILENYAVKLPLAQLRQVAAHKLSSEDVLERVIKASKGKDKRIWRICKDKLNALREEQDQEVSIEQQINELCHGMETLSRLPHDNLYAPKLEHLQKQWQRLQHHADNEAVQRFNRAYSLCKAVLDDINNEQDRLAEETQRRREALQERMAACEQLEAAVKQLSSIAVVDPKDIPALQALLNTQKIRWDEASSVVEPAADERKRFSRIHNLLQRALDAVRKLGEHDAKIRAAAKDILDLQDATMAVLEQKHKSLQKALGDLVWPEELAWPESLKLQQQALAHYERLRTKAKALEQEAIDNIRHRFTELNNEIELGHLKPANRLLKEANQLVKHLPVKIASNYQKQLRELTAKVNELRDWQGFVATPKKEDLCVEMEALQNADLDPQALASKIRRLQDEWRKLGEADKGRNKELWDRFSSAADKAYEPCRGYFDELSETRQRNLEKRQQICSQLSTYLDQYDWDNADWPAVNEVYETAKNEWRMYSPVERKEGKKAQEEFNDLLNKLSDKLQQEFERNKKQREGLIEQVNGLVEDENLSNAIDQTKELQRRWKQTGMVARRDDARLWKRFRSGCDQVFARRDKEREVAQQERQQNLVHGEHICEQIEQLAESHVENVQEVETELRQLKSRFGELGAFPRDQQEQINKSFKNVCEQVKQVLDRAYKAEREQRFSTLWGAIDLCDQIERQRLGDSASEALTTQIEEQWQQLSANLPVDAELPLKQRYQRIQDGFDAEQVSPSALQDNADQLRDLCIRLEIAAGVDTPAQDQQRRMELQVDRLADGLSQRSENTSVTGLVEQLQMEWCSVGPVASPERQQYTQRFKSALAKV